MTALTIIKITRHNGFARLHFSDGTALIVTHKDADNAQVKLG